MTGVHAVVVLDPNLAVNNLPNFAKIAPLINAVRDQ
jgi:hypothetical protein